MPEGHYRADRNARKSIGAVGIAPPVFTVG